MLDAVGPGCECAQVSSRPCYEQFALQAAPSRGTERRLDKRPMFHRCLGKQDRSAPRLVCGCKIRCDHWRALLPRDCMAMSDMSSPPVCMSARRPEPVAATPTRVAGVTSPYRDIDFGPRFLPMLGRQTIILGAACMLHAYVPMDPPTTTSLTIAWKESQCRAARRSVQVAATPTRVAGVTSHCRYIDFGPRFLPELGRRAIILGAACTSHAYVPMDPPTLNPYFSSAFNFIRACLDELKL
jgi:hypothetical protein